MDRALVLFSVSQARVSAGRRPPGLRNGAAENGTSFTPARFLPMKMKMKMNEGMVSMDRVPLRRSRRKLSWKATQQPRK